MSSRSNFQLVTFVVPASSGEPMEVKVQHSGLRMVLVSRESVGLLDKTWQTLGVYFLLGPSPDPDRFSAYVGEVGKSNLGLRVKHHARSKEWWSRALLIASTNSNDDFNSAEIGWLEGRLYDVLNNAVACDVRNLNRPGDDSLTATERGLLERYVEPIMAALRACGAPPDTADQKPAPKGKKVTKFTETVLDLIAAGLLKPDTVLVSLRRSVTATATVSSDGRLEVNGSTFDSLSAAAKHASGTISEAGWDFWGAPSGKGGFVPLAELRSRLREDKGAVGASGACAPATRTTEPGAYSSTHDLKLESEIESAPTPKLSAGNGVATGVTNAPTPLFETTPETVTPGDSKTPNASRAAIKDIAAAAGVELPRPIFAKYRGSLAKAVIQRDGTILMDGEAFRSLSVAGTVARRKLGYAGKGGANTNGWTWWSFTDDDGSVKLLDELRKRATANQSSAE